jgi:hypothetical protein
LTRKSDSLSAERCPLTARPDRTVGTERASEGTGRNQTIVRCGGVVQLERLPVTQEAAGATVNRIAADILRIEAGKLAGHWDVIQDEATKEQSKSGAPMFGTTFRTYAGKRASLDG